MVEFLASNARSFSELSGTVSTSPRTSQRDQYPITNFANQCSPCCSENVDAPSGPAHNYVAGRSAPDPDRSPTSRSDHRPQQRGRWGRGLPIGVVMEIPRFQAPRSSRRPIRLRTRHCPKPRGARPERTPRPPAGSWMHAGSPWRTSRRDVPHAPYYLATPVAPASSQAAPARAQGRRPRKEVICS